MKMNMGNFDRIARVIAALIFAYLFFSDAVSGFLGNTLLVLGAVFLLTSLVSFCPLYVPFGINTCEKK
jgi:Ca2+/H+ antiporter